MGSKHVSTGVNYEEESFVWKIGNFDFIRKHKGLIESQQFQFETGHAIETPSKWTFYLIGEQEGQIGVGVQLNIKPDGSSVMASFELKVKKRWGGCFYQKQTGFSKIDQYDPYDEDADYFLELNNVIPSDIDVENLSMVSDALRLELDFTMCVEYASYN